MEINWLGLSIGVISSFLLGAVWYGPLFGKAWMNYQNKTKEDFQGNPIIPMIVSFIYLVVMGIFINFYNGLCDCHMSFWILSFLLILVCVLGMLQASLYEKKSFGIVAINAGYCTVCIVILSSFIHYL